MSIQSKKWAVEVIWWVVTFVITALIMLPIIQANIEFPWLNYNVIYLIAGITLVIYIFTLRHHPLAWSKPFKTAMILIVPILFFPILEGLHSFLEYCDQEGLQNILTHLPADRQNWFMKYIRIEYVIAGVTCFMGAFAMIIKMIRSLWRQTKYNQI